MLTRAAGFVTGLYHRLGEFCDRRHRLCKIIIFAGSAALLMLLSLVWTGSLVYYNGDSKMYISIADNFLDSGHFIQTLRDRENFVVPFGYPAILTLIRAVSRADILIALAQYSLFGLVCVTLYCAERNFFGGVGGFSVLMHCLMLWRIHYAAPGCVVTETWYMAALVFCVWLLSRKDIASEKRLTCAFIALFVGFVIRPVLGLLLVPLMGWMIFRTIQKKYPAKHLLALLGAAGVIMLSIGAINYRETGHLIFTEGYSGMSVYLLNSDNAAAMFDLSLPEAAYADGQYDAIMARPDLDYYEKHLLLGELGREYILSHPLVTAKAVAVKLLYMFFEYWYFVPVVAIAGLYFSCRLRPKFRAEFLLIAGAAALLALVTSFGIPEPRYAYAVFPFVTLFTSAAVNFGVRRFLPWAAEKLSAGKTAASDFAGRD